MWGNIGIADSSSFCNGKAHHPIASGHVDHAVVHQERNRCARCRDKLSPPARVQVRFDNTLEGFTKGMPVRQVASWPPPCVAVDVKRPAGLLRSAPLCHSPPVVSSMACEVSGFQGFLNSKPDASIISQALPRGSTHACMSLCGVMGRVAAHHYGHMMSCACHGNMSVVPHLELRRRRAVPASTTLDASAPMIYQAIRCNRAHGCVRK